MLKSVTKMSPMRSDNGLEINKIMAFGARSFASSRDPLRDFLNFRAFARY
jgi:hypothetical protein